MIELYPVYTSVEPKQEEMILKQVVADLSDATTLLENNRHLCGIDCNKVDVPSETIATVALMIAEQRRYWRRARTEEKCVSQTFCKQNKTEDKTDK